MAAAMVGTISVESAAPVASVSSSSSDAGKGSQELRRESTASTASTAAARTTTATSRESARERQRRQLLKAWLLRNGFSTVHSQRRKLGMTSYPLHVAVRAFDVEMVSILLDFGADPTKTNSWGETPEDLAIRKASRGDPHAVDDIIAMLREGAPEGDEYEDAEE